MTILIWGEKTLTRFEKEGRGTGEGAGYKPFLEVHDFSSQGRVARMPSANMDRSHHVFSDVEKNVLSVLEYSLSVVGIREQKALDRDATQKHALQLGIAHPCYPRTRVPTVMTVDFEVTLRTLAGKSIAWVDAKRTEHAKDRRSLEKLELVRSYGESIGVPHFVIYHSQIPKQLVRNIQWIRGALQNPKESDFLKRTMAELESRMTDELACACLDDRPLQAWCSEFDRRHRTETGAGLTVARRLMWKRIFNADLNQKDLARAPMNSFQRSTVSPSTPLSIRAVGAP